MAEEKRMAENYEITQGIRIGDREVVLGVDPTNENPYFCALCQRQQLGVYVQERYEQCAVGGDYVEAIEQFAAYLQEQCHKVREEQVKVTVPREKITADMCSGRDYTKSLVGKIAAIKPEVFRPEYQTADHQLVLVEGGSGAQANSRGNACFTRNLYSGDSERFERYEVMGEVKPEYLPDWAKERAAAIQRQQAEKARKKKSAEQER